MMQTLVLIVILLTLIHYLGVNANTVVGEAMSKAATKSNPLDSTISEVSCGGFFKSSDSCVVRYVDDKQTALTFVRAPTESGIKGDFTVHVFHDLSFLDWATYWNSRKPGDVEVVTSLQPADIDNAHAATAIVRELAHIQAQIPAARVRQDQETYQNAEALVQAHKNESSYEH